jgi:HlyD family secretion protein
VSRGRIIAAVGALVVIAVIALVIVLSQQSRIPTVSVAEVQKENLTQTVTASGQLEGDVKADVFPPTQGTLKSVSVSDGQQVKAGQVLALMDVEPLDAQLLQARQGLRQAQAQLVVAQRSQPGSLDRAQLDQAVNAASAGVTNAQAALQTALTQLSNAKTQRDNDQSSLNSAISHGDATGIAKFEQAVAGDKATINQLDLQIPNLRNAVAQANAGLASAKANRSKGLNNQNAQVTAARAGVNSAEEAVQVAAQNRAKATLTAPIDGVVVFAGSSASAAGASALASAGGGGKPQPGSAVSPATAPFTVFQLSALNFDAQVDEADISHVGVGMKATVTLDAYPGVTFDTQVVQVKTQAIQTSTGGTAFPVLLSLKSTGKRLLVGMGGNADIEVSGIEGAVTVPVEALFDESGGTYVYVVDNSNVVHRTKVKTGIMTDTRAQILSGVTPGQKIALGGLSTLKDGMTVRVK